MKFAEIITIGDELLIGQVIDTNSPWIAQELLHIGINVRRMTSVSDNKEQIITALNEASMRVDIVLITGGLGPTRDDITKETLCEFFGYRVIEESKPVNNQYGSASGIWVEKGDKLFISIPGVPHEMMGMMSDEILPQLHKLFNLQKIHYKTILTTGIGESALAEKIADWEEGLAKDHLGLAYLPYPEMVKLRLTADFNDSEAAQKLLEVKVCELNSIIQKYIFGYDDDTIESVIGKLLINGGHTLSTVESCTGGYISHLITSVPGSSAYFTGSVVPYANNVKSSLLAVSEKTILEHGAVSEAVAVEMANGIRNRLKTDFSIATTGIAGPSGGTSEKPVGTVWIAIGSSKVVKAKKFIFGDNRERIIKKTAMAALNMLRDALNS